MYDPSREFEQPDQRAEHFAQLHFAGCPNCGYAVDVTVAALRHGDALLALLQDLVDKATSEELKEAMSLMRGTYDARVTIQVLEDGDFFELKELAEKIRERPRRAERPRRRRTG